MKKNVAVLITISALVVGIALGIGAVWMMSRGDNAPTIGMPLADPTKAGASLKTAEPDGEALAPTDLTPNDSAVDLPESSPKPSSRVPNPLFWMVLGGASTAIGILVATREKKTIRRW